MSASEVYVQRGAGEQVATASVNRSVARIRTAQSLFILAAGASFLFSIYLWFLVDREQGMFVGLWVPSILSLGALLLAKGDQS